jgi:flavin reductase (DIM6/NTAB) family NADH-FMN oxidoreductase RutF
MAKVVQRSADPFYFHYPSGATIVTSHARGRDNAMAVAWHTAVSRKPPYYAISIAPKRFTHGLIVESGEFVVNFMPFQQGELVALVGGCSGHEVDKFKVFDIRFQRGSQVKAPVLAAAIAAYECRVVGRHSYSDHDLFVGEVLAVQWAPLAFTERQGLDLAHFHPIVYMGEDRYATAAQPVHWEREALVKAALEKASRPP